MINDSATCFLTTPLQLPKTIKTLKKKVNKTLNENKSKTNQNLYHMYICMGVGLVFELVSRSFAVVLNPNIDFYTNYYPPHVPHKEYTEIL